MERSSQRDAFAYTQYTAYKRTGLCEYGKVGGVATKMRAFFVFHWNI